MHIRRIMSNMSFPGIAAATGTRVDSSAKHTMACRVSEPLMITWCADQQDGRNHLHNHKMKYCVHKNDLVLNCGQPLNDTNTIMLKCNQAYPAVVSNLGDMSKECKNVLKWLYAKSSTGAQFLQNKRMIQTHIIASILDKSADNPWFGSMNETPSDKLTDELKNLPYFTAQGFALGLAYASQLSGDTVSTVLIGGMQTVMNGDFECRAGQMIQWYFEHESGQFHKQTVQDQRQIILGGMRKIDVIEDKNIKSNMEAIEKKNPPVTTEMERKRKAYNDRELGAMDGKPLGGMIERKGNIALPKPYMLRPDGAEHYADKIRIFAKCISGARPNEMMDVMLMTQSL